jgi:tRNA(Ile)-lysidine synthase
MDRDQIRAYLDSIGARHVVDSSNESMSILRNRIRHKLLPMLEREYVAGISRRIVELAQEMRDADQFLDRAASAELSSMADAEGLDLVRLDAVDPALRMRVLRLFIESRLGSLRRIGRSHIEALARLSSSGPPNGEVSLPGGWCAIRAYGRLRIAKATAKVREQFAVPIAFEGSTEVIEAGIAFDASITDSRDAGVPGGPDSAIFDIRALAERGLVARSFRPGDRIRPLGMNGTRKVKDVFIDRKVPLIERRRFPIVASGNEILWLPGVLRAEGARVTSSSETVLLVRARRVPELPY